MRNSTQQTAGHTTQRLPQPSTDYRGSSHTKTSTEGPPHTSYSGPDFRGVDKFVRVGGTGMLLSAYMQIFGYSPLNL